MLSLRATMANWLGSNTRPTPRAHYVVISHPSSGERRLPPPPARASTYTDGSDAPEPVATPPPNLMPISNWCVRSDLRFESRRGSRDTGVGRPAWRLSRSAAVASKFLERFFCVAWSHAFVALFGAMKLKKPLPGRTLLDSNLRFLDRQSKTFFKGSNSL